MRTLQISIILFFLLYSIQGLSQFAEVGTKWHYHSSKLGGAAPPDGEYFLYESVKDTLIDSLKTFKIAIQEFKYNGDTLDLDPVYIYSANDSVYYYNKQYQSFLLLYDFTAKKGDTLEFCAADTQAIYVPSDSIFRLVIDSVVAKKVDTIYLKHFYTTHLDNYHLGGVYVERIGSLNLMLPEYESSLLEKDGPLRCYEDSVIFKNYTTNSCDYKLTISLEEHLEPFQYLSISYRAAYNELLVQGEGVNIQLVEFYGLGGKLIKSVPSKGSAQSIDVSNLKPNVYLMKIQTDLGVKTEKLMLR